MKAKRNMIIIGPVGAKLPLTISTMLLHRVPKNNAKIEKKFSYFLYSSFSVSNLNKNIYKAISAD